MLLAQISDTHVLRAGTRLFDRSKKGSELTAAGRLFRRQLTGEN